MGYHVTNDNGGPQQELFVLAVTLSLGTLLRNIALPWIFLGGRFDNSPTSYWFKFLLDSIFLIAPGILCLTVLQSCIYLVCLVLAVCVATILVFILCEYSMSPDRVPMRVVMGKIIDEQNTTVFLTYFRGSMLIVVGIAILAVDFPVFPVRFAKTERYGHSLMDIGVSAFVIAAAFGTRLKEVSNREPKSVRKGVVGWLMSSYVLLPLIGLARTIALSILSYHQPVTEYGVHWNFFYTLAVIRIVSKVLPSKYPVVFAVLFSTFQQSLLTNGVQDWVLDGKNPRDNLINMNAEGICSLPGYLALHYAGMALAGVVAKTGIRVKSWLECTLRQFGLSLSFLIAQLLSERALGPPCRRLVNLPYIFSQISLMLFIMGCFLVCQMICIVAWAAKAPHFSAEEGPFRGARPCIFDSVNSAGLIFFILTNIFTGMINLSIDTGVQTTGTSVSILTGYILLVCIAVHYKGYLDMKAKKNQ